MWIHRKPYKNQPTGGIPSELKNLLSHLPEHTIDVSKNGIWYATVNSHRIMARKYKSPLMISYSNSSGYHSKKGTWKFRIFNATSGDMVKDKLDFWSAVYYLQSFNHKSNLEESELIDLLDNHGFTNASAKIRQRSTL